MLLYAVPHLLCAAEPVHGIAKLQLQLPCTISELLGAAWQACSHHCPSLAMSWWEGGQNHESLLLLCAMTHLL